MLRKFLLLATSMVFLTGGAAIGVVSPASAAGVCAGKAHKFIELRFNAFAGHAIVANNKFCFKAPVGTVGPLYGISGTTPPTISLPSRLPMGGGESVELISGPDIISTSADQHIYRITIKQGAVMIPPNQSFSFDIHYYGNGTGKICFVGGSCGPTGY
ncbi:hypothetical protein [Nocardioides sp. InS609-2]|uniref:hypothetical protein n=1 Tax=Nocardioides sp. InS609-2 TaxID=2760705 RepID=UPI0020BDCA93|nr:hypothetical protein [Nocardioides sp. InS609-2]